MKLGHQINLAFGLMLLAVMSVTAVVLHYALLDHLIGVQKADLKIMSQSVSDVLTLKASEPAGNGVDRTEVTVSLAGVQAIVADKEGRVVYGAMPEGASQLTAAVAAARALPAQPIAEAEPGWNGTKLGYLMDVRPIPEGTLTLMTPMKRIEEMERALFLRLLWIFAAGGVVVYLLSLLLTRKLTKPLMLLKTELEKVKDRRFSDVRRVRAGGEIGAVAQTVHDLAEELHRYSVAQKHFFQNASHELKTPLMSISGYAEGIRDGVFEGEGMHRGLEIIMKESNRLKKLVSEMMLLAKLDSEEDIYKSSKVNLTELLTETAERLNPVLAARGLQMDVPVDQGELYVDADKDKLLQALLNVASNAARYARSRIRLSAEGHGGRVVLRVADDGDGISGELLPYMFHRFVKGKDGESGLGLAIARAIVERCGGSISAGNRAEGGAELVLELPAAA
ncbi:sensor histidine kinase [Gorillibacterium sp. sgz5001074]|uniref:sensor histidine kinase n=1 Tax=Gorillibacterium sp. sgz5001074 TaxID=3446695 RepID=UPI003F669451